MPGGNHWTRIYITEILYIYCPIYITETLHCKEMNKELFPHIFLNYWLEACSLPLICARPEVFCKIQNIPKKSILKCYVNSTENIQEKSPLR